MSLPSLPPDDLADLQRQSEDLLADNRLNAPRLLRDLREANRLAQEMYRRALLDAYGPREG